MLLVLLAAILGLIIGSFLNAVIFRLKSGEQFITGHSKCPNCCHQLSFFDLIPLFSFIFLKAKCRYCAKSISWQYPLVELVTALVFVVGYWKFFMGTWENENMRILFSLSNVPIFPYLAYLIFSCFLIIIFVYDLRYSLILDKVSLTALVIAFVANYLLGKPLLNLVIAALIIGGFFLLQFVVSKGKWLGGGDIRLGLVMGAMLGWPLAIVALGLAYIIGAAFGLILIVLKKKSLSSQLPFGTFLSLTTWACLLWGQQILDWYLERII